MSDSLQTFNARVNGKVTRIATRTDAQARFAREAIERAAHRRALLARMSKGKRAA